jgi:primosomal protein N''
MKTYFFHVLALNLFFSFSSIFAVKPPHDKDSSSRSNMPAHNAQHQQHSTPVVDNKALMHLLSAKQAENTKLKAKIAKLEKRLAEYEPGASNL